MKANIVFVYFVFEWCDDKRKRNPYPPDWNVISTHNKHKQTHTLSLSFRHTKYSMRFPWITNNYNFPLACMHLVILYISSDWFSFNIFWIFDDPYQTFDIVDRPRAFYVFRLVCFVCFTLWFQVNVQFFGFNFMLIYLSIYQMILIPIHSNSNYTERNRDRERDLNQTRVCIMHLFK